MLPRGGQTKVPSTRPSNASRWPSGQATHSAETKCAVRAAGAVAPGARKRFSISRIAAAKSLAGPAQRAEWMPGAPPSASTTSPESSANAGSRTAMAAATALMRAFSPKLAPVSSGSPRPSSAAATASTP